MEISEEELKVLEQGKQAALSLLKWAGLDEQQIAASLRPLDLAIAIGLYINKWHLHSRIEFGNFRQRVYPKPGRDKASLPSLEEPGAASLRRWPASLARRPD